jgi:hypothetical protein
MKKKLNQLAELVETMADMWDDPMYVTARVIISNMAFDADNKKQEDFDTELKALRLMHEYAPNNHVLHWAYNEANMQVIGHFAMLDYDNVDGYYEFKMPPDDMKEDRLYSVWHCVNTVFSEERKQKRTFIGSVLATTLEEAFTFSQNEYDNWSKYMTRSTSIGDVIETPTGKYYLVLAGGFTLIDEDDLGSEVDLNSFENQPTE